MRGILERDRRKALKEARKLVKHGALAMHVGSLAVAIEALECILVENGILKPDELMGRIEKLGKEKAEHGNLGRNHQTDGECGPERRESGQSEVRQAQG
jgi:hypothetical protein